MSDAQLEELNFIRKIGPLNLFWGTETDSMERIEAAGFNDYYIIAQEKVALPPVQNKPQEYQYRPTMFLVTKTLMGRAVVLADQKEADLFQSASESAFYDMPKMPYDMVHKMDQFFRLAHKKHGSEAILVLTYDMDYRDAEDPTLGWNCIAPTQSNSSVACDYQLDSILDRKKENEFVLGTIHSHPEMSAYFSSTDHKDQADWDGIHITQAWRGQGPTEYHIAMNLGGKEWTLTEEQVFAKPPLPVVDTADVDDWLEHVEKKSYATGPQSGSHHTTMYGGTSSAPHKSLSLSLPTQSFLPAEKVRAIKLPADAPNPEKTVIIPEYPESILEAATGSVKCRLCTTPLLPQSLHARRCIGCSGFILLEGETVEELSQYRTRFDFAKNIHIDTAECPYPISIYRIDGSFSDDQRLGDFPKV